MDLACPQARPWSSTHPELSKVWWLELSLGFSEPATHPASWPLQPSAPPHEQDEPIQFSCLFSCLQETTRWIQHHKYSDPENAKTRGLLPHPFLNCLDGTLRAPVQFTRTASLVGATYQFIEKHHEFGGCLQTALESLVKADDCLGMPGWSLPRLCLALLLNLESRGHRGTQTLSKTNWITPAGWRDTLAKLMTPKLLNSARWSNKKKHASQARTFWNLPFV